MNTKRENLDLEAHQYFWTCQSRDQLMTELMHRTNVRALFSIVYGDPGTGKSKLAKQIFTHPQHPAQEILLIANTNHSKSMTQLLEPFFTYLGMIVDQEHRLASKIQECLEHLTQPFILILDCPEEAQTSKAMIETLKLLHGICTDGGNLSIVLFSGRQSSDRFMRLFTEDNTTKHIPMSNLTDREAKSYILNLLQDSRVDLDSFTPKAMTTIIEASEGLLGRLNPLITQCVIELNSQRIQTCAEQTVITCAKNLGIYKSEDVKTVTESQSKQQQSGAIEQRVHLRELLLTDDKAS